MIYLFLGIICNTLISIVMRLSETRVRNTMVMITTNYFVCTLMGACIAGINAGGQLIPTGEGILPTFTISAIGGVFYLVAFILLRSNLRTNGVVLSTAFMKMGVLVPTLISIIFFREAPRFTQVIGLILAVAAILIMNLQRRDPSADMSEQPHKTNGIMLIILLLMGGMADAISKIYEELGAAQWSNQFIMFTFFSAFVSSVIVSAVQHQKYEAKAILMGVCLGVPNYFAARSILMSLQANIPAVIVYPTMSVGTIVVSAFAGMLLFKEKLVRRQVIAMLIILAALILLNI